MKKLTIVMLIIVLACGLVACGGDNTQPTPTPIVDPFYTKGYTKSVVTSSDMLSDLVHGVDNVLKTVTINNITDNTPEASIAFDGAVELNGATYNIALRLNYNKANTQKLALNLELRNSVSKAIVIAVYYFRGAHETTLYVQLNNNKIKIPLEPTKINTIFPLNPEKGVVEQIAVFFESVLRIRADSLKSEYKFNGNTIARHYFFKINFQESLKQLESWAAGYFKEYKEDIEFVLVNLLGVTLSDIKEGKMPSSEIECEFNTVGGYQTTYKDGKILDIKLKISVDESDNTNTVFLGKAFNAKIDIKSITAQPILLQNIKKEADLTSFVSYGKSLFKFKSDIFYNGDDTEYQLDAEFQYDATDPAKDYASLVVSKKSNNEVTSSIKYKDGIMNIALMDKGVYKDVSFKLDFGAMALEVGDLITGGEKEGILKAVVSFVGSFRFISDTQFSYTFVDNYIKQILGITPTQLVALVDKYSLDDINEALKAKDIDILSHLGQGFTIRINTDEEFITSLQK